VVTPVFRFAWWRCLLRGHEPDLEDLDWVGRPIVCVRCGSSHGEMARWQYQRFCGKAAIVAWNREASASMAWDEMPAAMVGEVRHPDPLMAQLQEMLDAEFSDFAHALLHRTYSKRIASRSF
jgi:hypothetical protein